VQVNWLGDTRLQVFNILQPQLHKIRKKIHVLKAKHIQQLSPVVIRPQADKNKKTHHPGWVVL